MRTRSGWKVLAQGLMKTSATQPGCGRLRIVGNRGSITVLRDRREEGMATITLLLQRAREGEQAARDSLFELAYDSLKGLARSRLRSGGRGGQLDTTALVHEAYLRFVRSGDLRADDRRAFFAYASSVMRSVIVDSARERLAERRGGDVMQVTLSTQVAESIPADDESILQVHEALTALAEADPRAAQVVEMRYFGGYTEQEIAEALDINVRTVARDWEKARLLLEVALK
jgi:RNA polymerase sigma factor (TIGR02999 family)